MEYCTHHWLLNNESYGVCKKCGLEKQFRKIKERANTYLRQKKNMGDDVSLDDLINKELETD